MRMPITVTANRRGRSPAGATDRLTRSGRVSWRRLVRHYRWRALFAGGVLIAAVVAVDASQRAEVLRRQWGDAVAVATAALDLPAGRVLTAADLVLIELPASTLPEGAGVPARELVGRTVTQTVLAGETIVDRRLAPSGLGPTAALVPAGHRAVAVPAGGAMPPLATGDRVDLLATGTPAIGGSAPLAGMANGALSDTVRVVARDVVVLDTTSEAITVVVPADQLTAVVAAARSTAVVPVLAGN
jgi:Flp pilus assembly protein CpaB